MKTSNFWEVRKIDQTSEVNQCFQRYLQIKVPNKNSTQKEHI